MCTYTNAVCAALHMCMCIHTGAVFTAPHMCTYTGACDAPHMCTYIHKRSLRCIANVYEYTLRIGFHRSTHVYIHKSSLPYFAVFIAPRMCTYTNAACPALHMCMCIHTGAVFTAPHMCTYTGACDAPRMCTYIRQQLTLHCNCV